MSVFRLENIEYDQLNGKTISLDITIPDSLPDTLMPVILYTKGGWIQDLEGDTSSQDWSMFMANQGFITVKLMDDRNDQADESTTAHAVQAAVRWLQANAAQYHIDPARIGMWGCFAEQFYEASVQSKLPLDAAQTAEKENISLSRLRDTTYTTWLDEAVNEFSRNGGFDNLPGMGKPLNIEKGDPLNSVLKNANYIPPWLELQHEIRDSIKSLINSMDTGEKIDIEQRVESINKKIKKYNQQVPNSFLQKSRLFPEMIREQLHKWE